MTQNVVIQLFLALGVIILTAKAAGYISRRVGQPAVLGELIVGLVLGPSLLNILGWSIFTDTHLGDTIQHIAEIGVLFLMFSAGLEVHIGELRRVGKVAVYSGGLGVIAPIVLTLPVALLAGHNLTAALFIGLTMAATSVSISAQTMLELGVLKAKEGIALLGAAVIDDILAIILLSVLIAVSVSGGGIGEVAGVIGKLVLFVVVATGLGWIVLPRLADRIADLPISSGVLALAVSAALIFGWGAEALGGMAAISGAFIAGLCFSRAARDVTHTIEQGLRSINYGLLVPIFFVSIGLKTNLRELTWEVLPFALALLGIAIISKVFGSGAGAWLGGFDNRSALRVGAGMVSRGEVGLIIGTVGLRAGLLPREAFPEIVLVIIATTIITPPLVRWAFREPAPTPAVAAYGEE
ncbi:MAG: cation:proton antiporter [Anaerolineae bacterium]|nr:cation:proton antiporter [Anaerolineae bacterium]